MTHRLVMLSLALLACLSAQQSPSTAFVDVTVVPMDRERVLPHQTVVVQSGRITELGPVKKVALPRGVRRVDGRGKYLLPGLADMHVHFTVNTLEIAPTILERFALLLVANGVTTVRNMRGAPHVLALRKQIETGAVLGPTIHTAGPLNDGKPPLRSTARVIETPEQAVEAVIGDKALGYDAVKVYGNLSLNAYSELVAAAGQQRLPVYGHVPEKVGLRAVLAARQDSVEHLDGYEWALQGDRSPYRGGRSAGVLAIDRWEHIDLAMLPELGEATRRAGTWNCPTIVVHQKLAISSSQLASELQRPEVKFLPSEVLASWQPRGGAITRRFSEEEYAYLRKRAEIAKQIVKGLHTEGARLLAGTDMPVPWVVPGFSLLQELQNLVDAGLSPYAAIRAATSDAAEFLNKSSDFGRVSIGVRADLLLVDANPLQDVSNVTRRAGVMVRGKWLPESELRNRLHQSSITALR